MASVLFSQPFGKLLGALPRVRGVGECTEAPCASVHVRADPDFRSGALQASSQRHRAQLQKNRARLRSSAPEQGPRVRTTCEQAGGCSPNRKSSSGAPTRMPRSAVGAQECPISRLPPATASPHPRSPPPARYDLGVLQRPLARLPVMKLSLWLVAALAVALPMSCKSSSSSSGSGSDSTASSVSSADVHCQCGTPLGDLEGCAHKSCLAGKNNPDNPDCVC